MNRCAWCNGTAFQDGRCWRCGEPDNRDALAEARALSYHNWSADIPARLNPWAGILVPHRVTYEAETGGWCERCAISDPRAWHGPPPLVARWHSSRTMYHWDGRGQDPNAPVALCDTCAEDHHERWDDMWSNVPGY